MTLSEEKVITSITMVFPMRYGKPLAAVSGG
jgi:hypothetical protein